MISPRTAKQQLKAEYPYNAETMPWLEKIDPESFVYTTGKSSASDLGFNHLIDELSNAINPESGLPRHLQFPADRLDKVSVPQAVERVDAINKWRAALKAEADQAKANNAATVLHKEYPHSETAPNPKGLTWKELTHPEAMTNPEAKQMLQDALKYEGDTMGHCVGGYCEDVASGKSRIYSLRDAKGTPHVTVEVAPKAEAHEWINALTEDEYTKLVDMLPGSQDPYNANPQKVLSAIKQIRPDLPEPPSSIVQIKGKGNLKPAEEYQPFVQDFVKSGKWSDVGDLQNAGLTAVPENSPLAKRMVQEQLDLPKYMTDAEYDELTSRFGMPKYAQGGRVSPNKIETPEQLRAIILAIQSGR